MRPVWMLPDECDWGQLTGPAVYRLYNGARELIYVGMTDSFINYRVKHHRQKKLWGGQIQYVGITYYPTSYLALEAEREAIKLERPLHNLRSAVLDGP